MRKYQESLFSDRTVPGDRDCAERWDLVARLIPDRGVMLDVGSNLGYFGVRSVLEHDELVAVSIESDEDIADRQIEVVASHGTDRICVIHGSLNSSVSENWSESCDWFDITLLLSVLHWMDDPAAVLRDLSVMSARIVVELPDASDEGACNRRKLKLWADPGAWLAEVTGREVSLLGRVGRHTSDTPAHMFLIDGPVSRKPTKSYWGSNYRHPLGNEYRISYSGETLEFSIRGALVEYLPGVNLVNLGKLGTLKWPPAEVWKQSATTALRESPGHRDPLPHNMLWTPWGIRLIDSEDRWGDADSVEAIRTCSQWIDKWAEGKTVDEFAYVPHVPASLRRLRNWPRYMAAKVLPKPAKRLVRRLIGR